MKSYDTSQGKKGKESITNGTMNDTPSIFVTSSFGPLQIEKPNFDYILRPPKSTIQTSTFNPNSHAT
jgi:hypothetical protein